MKFKTVDKINLDLRHDSFEGNGSEGKNFFFDIITQPMINVGHIGNFNKYQNFPLQEAIGRRILMWNEPNFESDAEETLKCILGGDPCNVKIKFQNDACLRRTPIIIFSIRWLS